MEDSINSFVTRSKADLLVFYARDAKAHINKEDVERICNLVAYHQTQNQGKLNLLLHTLGGNINAAIALVDYLKSKYPQGINSMVISVAKSSGSFIAVCAQECYMHTGSVLSDFTLDPAMTGPDYTEAQGRSILLAFQGICRDMENDFWIRNFAFNTTNHGQGIPKAALLKHDYVKTLNSFPGRVKALGHLHNEIIKHFNANPTISKVYGLNGYHYQA